MSAVDRLHRAQIDAMAEAAQLEPWQTEMLHRLCGTKPTVGQHSYGTVTLPPRYGRGATVNLAILDELERMNNES